MGIDYHETFAPVAKLPTIRLVLALCCERDWDIHGMDVKTAFLNSELEETVYMEIPEGISIPTAAALTGSQSPMACRLLKSIYGLKQSPCAWYGRIHSFFISNNFRRSEFDHSLFINNERPVILLLYVNDLVLAAPTWNYISWIHSMLCKEFDMTDLGELQTFLELEIKWNRGQGILHLLQKRYVQKILKQHGMESCNLATTPADPHIRLEKNAGHEMSNGEKQTS